MAIMLSLWISGSQAGQVNAPFNVIINLESSHASTHAGICRSSSRVGVFGETVIVECATGKPVPFSGDATGLLWTTRDSSYRFITHISEAGIPLLTLDSHISGGPVTSWRKVQLAHRDYLELMIGW